MKKHSSAPYAPMRHNRLGGFSASGLFSVVISAFLVFTLLCGCGSNASYVAATEEMVYPEEAYDYGVKSESTVAMASGSTMYYGTDGIEVPESVEPTSSNVKLIYTATLEMESTAFDDSAAAIADVTKQFGGYYESSELNNYGSYRYAYYTIRVPAEHFDDFCTSAGQICQLNNISRSAEDVSEYYYDTESRLATQQTKLSRLQELLAKAEDMEDIITLESAISETEQEIESLTGTLRKYDSLVGYSTINLTLQEVYQLTDQEEPVIGFGAKLIQAFKTGCSNFVSNWEWRLLRIARNWTGWLVFVIIVVIAFLLIRKSVKKRRARIAEYRSQHHEERKCSILFRNKLGKVKGEETEKPAEASEEPTGTPEAPDKPIAESETSDKP